MIGKKIQNYKILSLLGEGGMGIVYKAIDIKLERFAALKILNINSTRFSYMMERFRKEARNQAKLTHPNIVSVYGFVEEKNIMGIAMEYIEGETIENIIEDEGRLETHHALDIISQVLEGISYAHSQGFIHRDLKPSNIIIDLNGNVKIMDFGISKSIDEIESITQYNARPGTLLYMSPEQLSGNEVTIKSDLYSLGITLYEMLAGIYPYDAKTFYEIVDAHVNKVPAKISDSLLTVPYELDEIILRAMGKLLNNNYSNALEFKTDVNHLSDTLNFQDSEFGSPNNNYSDKIKSQKEKPSFWNKLNNFFLFMVFAILTIIVYYVVKDSLQEKAQNDKTSSLNYSQDYTKNPNYIEQSEWELSIVNPEKNLNSIFFLDNLNGFIIGNNGLILKSSDGGEKWREIDIKLSEDLHSLFFNNGKLYCAGGNGVLLNFDFDNQRWEKIATNSNETLFNINFINHNIGIITGSNGLVLRSVDGGLTWEKINCGVSENLFRISFVDENIGYIVGWNGVIIKTEDQGLTWNRLHLGYTSYFKDILFVNQFLGFIVGGDGIVLKTEDGGDTWKQLDIGSKSGLYKIFFENNTDGIILTNMGEIFMTTDAGKSWKLSTVGKSVVLNDIQKLSTGKYIIVGNNGSIFKSKIKDQ